MNEDTKVAAPKMPAAGASRAPSASWGRDRIDQRELALDNNYTAQGSGSGVNAYILDTGIDCEHAEFDGRATFGFDAMPDAALQRGQDCQGHGTHVAGTVGGGSMALSGTSMAAPHVAGVIALYKQAHPSEQPADIANFVTDESTKDAVLKISKGTPNQLLFTSASDRAR
ncbi:S8 family serine peptidase [Streptomyces sp. NBC_00190]|uniref:S8 family serine peptidase n=1 Tax=Streptomyces sp. NBC_00190 TaxID=2903634 RepID=UPI002E2C722E|nr:S8 family serine peptidase [Streptomyces sp. NBC_00190]